MIQRMVAGEDQAQKGIAPRSLHHRPATCHGDPLWQRQQEQEQEHESWLVLDSWQIDFLDHTLVGPAGSYLHLNTYMICANVPEKAVISSQAIQV